VALRTSLAVAGACLILLGGCEAEPPREEPAAREAPAPESVPVVLAGERFHLELAADRASRHQGLSHRTHIPESSGMLFAFPEVGPLVFVMRHCVVPIDVAFLDDAGRVVALHAMAVEPPQRGDETPFAYESRLRRYASGAPARFALELAGGTLARLGLRVGDAAEFDRAAVLRRAR
jgi:hypothetical protein